MKFPGVRIAILTFLLGVAALATALMVRGDRAFQARAADLRPSLGGLRGPGGAKTPPS